MTSDEQPVIRTNVNARETIVKMTNTKVKNALVEALRKEENADVIYTPIDENNGKLIIEQGTSWVVDKDKPNKYPKMKKEVVFEESLSKLDAKEVFSELDVKFAHELDMPMQSTFWR